MDKELVFLGENGEAVTDSYKVANVFEKEHRRVLQDIRELGCSKEFHQHNFVQMFNINNLPNGGSRKDPYYTITKDGFTFLVMGYTGAKAAQFKEAYIAAFNRMEQQMRGASLPHHPHSGELAKALDRINSLTAELENCKAELNYLRGRMDAEKELAAAKVRLEMQKELAEAKMWLRIAEMDRGMEVRDGKVCLRSKIRPATETQEEGPKSEGSETGCPASKYRYSARNRSEVGKRWPGAMRVLDMCRHLQEEGIAYVKYGEMFGWLRSNGYLLTRKDCSNEPSYECLVNGWMVFSVNGGTSGGMRYVTPYVTQEGYRHFAGIIVQKGGGL